jgi:hypothetical protein
MEHPNVPIGTQMEHPNVPIGNQMEHPNVPTGNWTEHPNFPTGNKTSGGWSLGLSSHNSFPLHISKSEDAEYSDERDTEVSEIS